MGKYFIKVIAILAIILLCASCIEDRKPPLTLEEMKNSEDLIIEKDTSLIKILSLPVYIDSTQYLYHPTTFFYKNIKSGRLSLSKDSYGSDNYTQGNYANYRFNGSYAGFAVEDIITGNIIKVTDQEINFSNAIIYNKLDHNPRVEFVVYEGYDLDTNKDKRLDYKDISSLFISNLDGSDFKKLSIDFEAFLSYKFIAANDKLYFRTMSDANNNGILEDGDEYRNYVVELKDSIKTAVRYDLKPDFTNN